jgi:hypothetical protein
MALAAAAESVFEAGDESAPSPSELWYPFRARTVNEWGAHRSIGRPSVKSVSRFSEQYPSLTEYKQAHGIFITLAALLALVQCLFYLQRKNTRMLPQPICQKKVL